jgi:hypothetical protein
MAHTRWLAFIVGFEPGGLRINSTTIFPVWPLPGTLGRWGPNCFSHK